MEKGNANASLLHLNGLRYQMPKPLSTTLVRTHKKQYSQRQSYTHGDTIVFDLNISGQVDPEMSYLTFEVSSDQNYKLSCGGIGAIIRDIRISSKNGVELDRIQSYNAWLHMYLLNQVDQNRLNYWQRLFGHDDDEDFAHGNAKRRFIIPCCWLSGLFRPHVKSQKIPAHLLSGARVEIVLENVGRAFQAATDATPPTKFDVFNPTLVLMEHTLNDNTLKVLTEESANNGLEYVYDRVFTSIETTSNITMNTQIKKAVSQATSITTTFHLANDQTDITKASFNGVDIGTINDVIKYQYRLGSNYFPHQAVDNWEEAFTIGDTAFRRMNQDLSVTGNDWMEYLTGGVHLSVPLKTDHAISSSGLAVNNSATIALELTYDKAGDQPNIVYYTFLTYTALARVFLNQVSAKI